MNPNMLLTWMPNGVEAVILIVPIAIVVLVIRSVKRKGKQKVRKF